MIQLSEALLNGVKRSSSTYSNKSLVIFLDYHRISSKIALAYATGPAVLPRIPQELGIKHVHTHIQFLLWTFGGRI